MGFRLGAPPSPEPGYSTVTRRPSRVCHHNSLKHNPYTLLGLAGGRGLPCPLSKPLQGTRQFSTVTQVNRGSTFTLRRSTLDFCLGGLRSAKGIRFQKRPLGFHAFQAYGPLEADRGLFIKAAPVSFKPKEAPFPEAGYSSYPETRLTTALSA